jgi:acyl-CoA thioesterase
MRGVTTDPSLEVNRARLEALFRSDGWVGTLGAELVEWGGGRAVFRLRPEVRHGNFVGTTHGGALFSLADAAIGVASNSWGRVAVLLTAESQFLSAPQPGEVLVARAEERSRTRRTAAYAVDITSEADGVLRATFSAMCFRTGRWHLGDDAWPEDYQASH